MPSKALPRTLALKTCALLLALAGCSDDSAPATDEASLPISDANSLTAVEQEEGWRLLFDGTTLDGWVPRDSALWRVEEGAISPEPGSGPGFLTSAESFGNFHLRVDFWVDSIANGGVFLRVPADSTISAMNSLEVNIFDAHAEWPTGSVNLFHKNEAPATAGQWNSYDIRAEGEHITVTMNGQVTADVQAADRLPSGSVALQLLGDGVIRYRNIRIRTL